MSYVFCCSKNRGGIETATFLLKLLSGASDLVSVNASYNLMPVESIDIIHSALKIAKGTYCTSCMKFKLPSH